MDLRITNFCNNNCYFCLEQEYRKKARFINISEIIKKTKYVDDKKFICFYGGNPLLHPDIFKIIKYIKQLGFEKIGILTNSYGINKDNVLEFKNNGITDFGIYFNSILNHNTVVNGGINIEDLLLNLKLIIHNGFDIKLLININALNIKTLYKDILYLVKNFGILKYEFINYFPFDRGYKDYNNVLNYDFENNRLFIDKLFSVIKRIGLKVKFMKFSKDFFGQHIEFYDFKNGIQNQVGKEDFDRLNSFHPYCLEDNRCKSCFIKDICKFYD